MEREYYLGFSIAPGIGPLKFSLLLSFFGTAKDAWGAEEKELAQKIGPRTAEKFVVFRKTFSFGSYTTKFEKQGVAYIAFSEKGYPTLLREIKNPPIVLFVKGKLDFNDSNHHSIGIVGTRKITSYGRDVTEMITRDLVASGCVIVSGLALGVDAVAHQTTVENMGRTIAVLGCGVDLCYPSANMAIYNSILASGGSIVSEYPPGQPPSAGSFPSRNRIIAGLSEAVVVTEGAEDSGALITAEDALKNGRKVFAVPGPITSSLSKGPLKLLRQGAKIVTSGDDILKELQTSNAKFPMTQRKKIAGETKEEQRIIDLLENEGMLFDELVRKLQTSSTSLSTILTLLEVRGIVRNSGGKFQLVTD